MYEVIPTERFEKDVKYYVKKKGFVHIGTDIKAITDELEKGNLVGTEIPGLKIATEGHTFKVRSANSDTKMGQSNGTVLYIMQSVMMRKYICLPFITKRMITGYLQIRKS